MKDGYYYFIPASADKTDVDKSLGYLCVTKYPKGASYSIQCSLSQEIAAKIGGQGLIEIFLSPTTYITAQSILIGKIFVAPKVRLFVDSSLQASAVNVFDEDQYAIITANGRTLCYSVLVKKKNAVPPPDPLHEIQAEPTPLPIQQAPQQQQQVQQRRQPEPPNVIAEPPRTPFQGKDFDFGVCLADRHKGGPADDVALAVLFRVDHHVEGDGLQHAGGGEHAHVPGVQAV